jgi:hypothetical protein
MWELGEIVVLDALKEAQVVSMVVIDFVDVIFTIGHGLLEMVSFILDGSDF